jgi:cell division protein FtsQ
MVLDLVYQDQPDDVLGHALDSININLIEQRLTSHPFIRHASIYKTISGKLKVDVVQRYPVLMIINREGQEYYIDSDGMIFPTSDRYSSLVIVANGNIKEKFDFSKGQIYKVDLTEKKNKTTADLFKLAQLIQKDDFWRDQIEQIYVNNLGEYELVPMLGPQILALGTIEDYDRKMYILKEFYFQGMRKTGWNTYKLISVKYKNQIVCKRF